MKKSLLTIAIAIAAFSSAFANAPSGLNDRAVAAFQKEFHKASEVKWAVTNNYVLAQFKMDNEIMFAYYDFDGNMIGLIHHILTSELSSDLQSDIKKHYSNYWVSELFQVTTEQGVYYYIQLKNADETLVLSTEGANSWHRYAMPKNTIEKL